MATIPQPNGVWKWLAAFFAGIVLAGFPAAFVSLSAPSREDLEELRREVVAGQVQSARIEERLSELRAELEALRASRCLRP